MLIWPTSSRGRGALIAALLAAQTVPALADRDPRNGAPPPPSRKKKEIPSPITDRFYIEGIFYAPVLNTDLRVDPSHAAPGVTGTSVNVERDLGQLHRLYQGRMELMFRLRERSKLRVDYENVDRSASKLLSRTIQFGNQTFFANDQADTALAWRIFTLTYTYSVYRNDWLEIGTGLAAHLIEAQAHGAVVALNEHQDVAAAAGFATIPLDIAWRVSRRIAITAREQYFRVDIRQSTGLLSDAHADVQYRWYPNFSLGAGYTYERIDVQLQNLNSFRGVFSTEVKGPEAFFRVSF